MHSVCCCSLPVWRRSFLKKGTPVTYFCPALGPPLDGSGRKTTTLVRDLEYLIHTKFHQNPSSGSGEVENVNCLTYDGRQTTDAGQRMITIGHWRLLFLCPKKTYILSNKSNAQNRKLNHKFSSTVKVFMNIDVRYIYDKTFESTIKLRDYWTMTFLKGYYHLHPITEHGYPRIVKIASFLLT